MVCTCKCEEETHEVRFGAQRSSHEPTVSKRSGARGLADSDEDTREDELSCVTSETGRDGAERPHGEPGDKDGMWRPLIGEATQRDEHGAEEDRIAPAG